MDNQAKMVVYKKLTSEDNRALPLPLSAGLVRPGVSSSSASSDPACLTTSFSLLLSLILFLPEPVRCTRLASSKNRALDPEPEMDDLDKGDRVFEAELVRDDLEGVSCSGGMFS